MSTPEKPTTSAPALLHRIPAACARLSIGRNALYDLLREGKLRKIHVGKRTLIAESELQRFIAEQLRAAA